MELEAVQMKPLVSPREPNAVQIGRQSSTISYKNRFQGPPWRPLQAMRPQLSHLARPWDNLMCVLHINSSVYAMSLEIAIAQKTTSFTYFLCTFWSRNEPACSIFGIILVFRRCLLQASFSCVFQWSLFRYFDTFGDQGCPKGIFLEVRFKTFWGQGRHAKIDVLDTREDSGGSLNGQFSRCFF